MELLHPPPQEDFHLSASAGSVWTWVAILTAAIGLWHIRAGSKPVASTLSSSPRSPPKALPAQRAVEIRPCKERFTMVYYINPTDDCGESGCIKDEEMLEEEEEEKDFAGGGEADGELMASFDSLEWMGVQGRRINDFAWYRFQDRVAINGSVVRLWGGGGLRQRRRV